MLFETYQDRLITSLHCSWADELPRTMLRSQRWLDKLPPSDEGLLWPITDLVLMIYVLTGFDLGDPDSDLVELQCIINSLELEHTQLSLKELWVRVKSRVTMASAKALHYTRNSCRSLPHSYIHGIMQISRNLVKTFPS